MQRGYVQKITYKGPDGAKQEFNITLDLPETGKDYQEIHPEAAKEDWNNLAKKQYLTNQANDARRKAVDEATGKGVGVREFARFLREAGISPDEAMSLLKERAGK